MTKHTLEGLATRFDKRASQKRRIAFAHSISVIVLFIIALFVVVAAENIAEFIVTAPGTTTESVLLERLETVLLRPRFDFNGIATTNNSTTAMAVGDDGVIMISDDDRTSWRKVRSNTTRRAYGIALSDNGKTAVAVGSIGLIRFSRDGGETWINPGNVTAKDIYGVALSGDGKIAVAVGESGLILISEDGGENWESPKESTTEEDINGVALNQSGEVIILVGDEGFISISTDGGQKWNTVKRDNKEFDDFNAVAVSADGKTAIAVGGSGWIYRSEDRGRRWKFVKSNVGLNLNAVTLNADGSDMIAVGEDGTVLVSTDRGKNWVRRNSGTAVDLNTVALEKDARAALIFGDDRTTLEMLSSGQEPFARIAPIEGLRIVKPLSEEEKDNIDEEVEKGESNIFRPTIIIYSSSLRIGSILVLLLWIRHAAGMMLYNLRLAAYYDARADAAGLVGWEESPQLSEMIDLRELIRAVSPDDLDIGKSPRGMVEWAVRLVGTILRSGSEKAPRNADPIRAASDTAPGK